MRNWTISKVDGDTTTIFVGGDPVACMVGDRKGWSVKVHGLDGFEFVVHDAATMDDAGATARQVASRGAPRLATAGFTAVRL